MMSQLIVNLDADYFVNWMGNGGGEKSRKHRVAILLEDLSDYSGVSAVALFLYRILSTSGRYEPEIITLSSSMSDANSTRVLSPSSWFRKAIQTSGEWHGLPYRHVGAEFTELEFQRYRPRRALTDLLNEFEIVQIVSGIPPWGLVARNCDGKVALQVATLSEVERVSMLKKARGARRAWLWLMTRINIALERPAMRRADLVFVENRWMYERLKAEYGERKIIFAPPGVDTDFFCQGTYQPKSQTVVTRLVEKRVKMADTEDNHHREGGLQLCVDVCREVAKNTAMAFPQVRRWRLKKPRAGALFTGRDEDLERYAFFPLRNLLEVMGSVTGLDILEIGPGDFMTSGLSLLAAGAKSYTVIDRFVGDYQKPEAKAWYRGIKEAWPRLFPDITWPDYLKTEDFPEAYTDRIEILTGTIEEASAPKQYDVICSYQVGEHVNDIEAFARANAQFLKQNGVAVHRVDFGPHDCWTYYEDRLTFLRFPDWLWRLMGSNRGTPNRQRYHQICEVLERAGLKVEVIGLELFSEEMVARARLDKRFQGMPLDSLTVGTAIFVCRL